MCFGVVTAESTFSDADLVAFNTFFTCYLSKGLATNISNYFGETLAPHP